MGERVLAGVPASPGTAVGAVQRWDMGADDFAVVDPNDRAKAVAVAFAALDAASAQVAELAERLRRAGHADEADIVDTGALMGVDPALRSSVEAAILRRGMSPSAAIKVEIEAAATMLDAISDPLLAARAADVRSLGRRAARLTRVEAAAPADVAAPCEVILIAADLGPADIPELAEGVRGVALAGGGVTSHAAIVARSLGLPMVVGLGPAVLELVDGELLIVDGDRGVAVASPQPPMITGARQQDSQRRAATHRAAADGSLPAVTRDGRHVRVLANASSLLEVRVALRAGAEGVGLLRTELAFLDALRWPTREQHAGALRPVLAQLSGRTATVRILDFGGDKTPPFLEGSHGRGVELLLQAPEALAAQLNAILDTGAATELRVLVPMVTEPAQVRAVRAALDAAAMARDRQQQVVLGAMVEVPAAAVMADHLAAEVGLLSIGTNDLTSFQLGLERGRPGRAPVHHPAVLRLIASTIEAAHAAGIAVEVCGEAASDPLVMPLLVGLAVSELSVGAAAVGRVRQWIRRLDFAATEHAAKQALEAESAEEVEAMLPSLTRLLDDAV
ncbi:MAG: phosphoenolpyruvate--protein phosphotransferase [Candidatus Dormibacteraeota bacterium]|nr:phosphoenolpyruvate--protein phosphotransferase [Candidatus Dormibacteraeota bacterium]